MALNDWHFPKETVTFLRALKKNNDRQWFTANKDRYERFVKEPAEIFAELMIVELEQLTGEPHKPKIFRIYRDVRFSKDKTPYNSHIHMTFFPVGGKAGVGWFFGLNTDEVTLGGGVFRFEKDALDTYRKRVAGPDGEELAETLDGLFAKGGRINDPPLKRVPKPYEQDHPRAELLKRKGLAVWKDIGKPSIATSGNLIERCDETFTEIKPVVDWLS
ncbi:MAG: DUF2461 domain-containing protein [Pseudomonadota bacterium]